MINELFSCYRFVTGVSRVHCLVSRSTAFHSTGPISYLILLNDSTRGDGHWGLSQILIFQLDYPSPLLTPSLLPPHPSPPFCKIFKTLKFISKIFGNSPDKKFASETFVHDNCSTNEPFKTMLTSKKANSNDFLMEKKTPQNFSIMRSIKAECSC